MRKALNGSKGSVVVTFLAGKRGMIVDLIRKRRLRYSPSIAKTCLICFIGDIMATLVTQILDCSMKNMHVMAVMGGLSRTMRLRALPMVRMHVRNARIL